VLLAHGGGGRLTQMLIDRMFLPTFDNPTLEMLHDGAILEVGGSRLAFSTDSFVISPLFFPGGDIGSLAVHGTLNDLAMCGAQPLGLSTGFILEEGLPMEDLWRVVQSIQGAAQAAGVSIMTGDTKVVDRGKGAIAVHGMAIMSVREGLEFETALESDSAALHGLVAKVLEVAGDRVHVLRDPTRGGVASALNEIAVQAQVGVRLEETRIPIWEEVRGACEILGLDPLYVANEGKCLVIVDREAADNVLAAMRGHPLGQEAAIIGDVVKDHPGKVFMRSRIGGMRVVDVLSGEQLPRIC
jgi:hydrogenase expression/formation protein HypE